MSNYVPASNDGKPASRGNYVVRDGLHCEVFESGWNYKVWQSSDTGQLEHKLWPRLVYVAQGDPEDPDDADVWADPPIDQSGTLMEQERLEKQRLLALEKSARRAKQQCSHKIKEAGFSSMLTNTYAENMQDFDRMRRDWAAFMRKVTPHIPNFACVYAFEQQKRGAWHVHAAIHKLPVYLWVPQGRGKHARKVMVRSWDYLRRCWRAIVGKGNIDVDGHRKRGRAGHGGHRAAESLARLAGYISKYLTKDHAKGPPGRNRWGSTQGINPPKARIITLPAMPMLEAILMAFHVPEGHRVVQHRMGADKRFWCLYSEAFEPDEVDTPVTLQ
jgi:hypothetical protein